MVEPLTEKDIKRIIDENVNTLTEKDINKIVDNRIQPLWELQKSIQHKLVQISEAVARIDERGGVCKFHTQIEKSITDLEKKEIGKNMKIVFIWTLAIAISNAITAALSYHVFRNLLQ